MLLNATQIQIRNFFFLISNHVSFSWNNFPTWIWYKWEKRCLIGHHNCQNIHLIFCSLHFHRHSHSPSGTCTSFTTIAVGILSHVTRRDVTDTNLPVQLTSSAIPTSAPSTTPPTRSMAKENIGYWNVTMLNSGCTAFLSKRLIIHVSSEWCGYTFNGEGKTIVCWN